MQRALCISATFLTSRYHGAEWPPSPARLMQAMLAGIMTGGYRVLRPQVEPALRWLERQPAPQILAVPVAQMRGYRLAVPNNDMDVIANEWAAGRPANPAELRTMKDVNPRSINGPPPHIRYVWPLDEDAERDPGRLLAAAMPLSHCLYSFGWGIDTCFADAELLTEPAAHEADVELWVPGHPPGEQLAVPVPGFLADLDQTYKRFVRRASGIGVDTDTRPSVYRLQSYVRAGDRRIPLAIFGLRAPDGASSWSAPWESTIVVSAWLRHAAAEALRQEDFPPAFIDSFVLGHPLQGGDPSFRMSFVPLPSIGHGNADGRIRRVMIVEPSACDGAVCHVLGQKLLGWVATDDANRPVCCFGPVADQKVISFYYSAAQRRFPQVRSGRRSWRSVTPVILHGYNSSHGKVSLHKTERLLLRAFEMAGYSENSIASLAFQPAPLWHGTGASRQVRVPKHLEGLPRYHVEVEFRTDVLGPVLAGVGRHCGLGVFASHQ